jgi:NAD(P)-dependent dehydrogenase (short-subunit alcohol dehydrogenase family)
LRLDGARCLVTGGSRGIGRELAFGLAKSGATVYTGSRHTVESSEFHREGITVLKLDVTDPGSVRGLLEEVGEIDVLVNNAGLLVSGAVEEVDDVDLLAQYETNVFGPWRLCRAVLPGMRRRGRGAIANICSIGGELPYPGLGAYRSSKHALRCLSWTLHFEVAHFGIRVLNVEPGAVDTDFSRRSKRFGSGATSDSPYEEMRAQADAAYSRIARTRTPPSAVAARVVEELSRERGSVDVVIGDDATEMLALARGGIEGYERRLLDSGFGWHPH